MAGNEVSIERVEKVISGIPSGAREPYHDDALWAIPLSLIIFDHKDHRSYRVPSLRSGFQKNYRKRFFRMKIAFAGRSASRRIR
jgi:hypothetical protein